jgi:hypothetical protein
MNEYQILVLLNRPYCLYNYFLLYDGDSGGPTEGDVGGVTTRNDEKFSFFFPEKQTGFLIFC